MPTFADYALEALEIIETAHSNGYLLYANEYVSKHRSELRTALSRKLIDYGMTTHTALFNQYQSNTGSTNPLMTFRLKPFVSASYALETLLSSGETVIDCGTGLLLTHIYACLLGLKDKYGPEQGAARFDLLFGSKHVETPTIQRLLFSNNGAMAGTQQFQVDLTGNISPLTPFSFLFGFSKTAKKAALLMSLNKNLFEKKILKSLVSKCAVGSIIAVEGHKDYYVKHGSGTSGNFNALILKHTTDGPLLRVFGHGMEPETEEDLISKHVRSFNTPQTLEDLLTASFRQKFIDQIAPNQVPGLNILSNIDVISEVWDHFINAPIHEVLRALCTHLNEQLKHRQSLLPEDQCSIPLPRLLDYHLPQPLSNQAVSLLTQLGGTLNVEQTMVTIDSNVLKKSVRDAIGIVRKTPKKFSASLRIMIEANYPQATIEQDPMGRVLITAPADIFPEVESAINHSIRSTKPSTSAMPPLCWQSNSSPTNKYAPESKTNSSENSPGVSKKHAKKQVML